MIICSSCSKEFEGYGKNCGTCRSKLSRQKPVANATETLATEPVAPVAEKPVATENKTCKCEEVEHLRSCFACEHAVKAGKKNCGQKYYICGKHQTHIEGYCQAMC